MVSAHAPSWSRICYVSDRTAKRIECAPAPQRFRALDLDILAFERHYRRRVTSRKIRVFPPIFAGWETKILDRRSLLVAGASSLASIMLPRVPGSENAFLLPFAPTAAYADEEDPFRVLVLSRTMFGVVVVDVANKNTPITGAQVTLTSRYAAGKQLTATTDDEGTAIFEVAPLSEGYVDEATLLDAYDFNGGISISVAGTVMSRFPSLAFWAVLPLPLPRVRFPTASRTSASSHSTNGTSSTPKPRSWHCRRTTRQTSSPIRTTLPCRHICHRVDRQRCASTK